MRKLIVIDWMTLDGVVQAPSYPDEDTEGGFSHGGWHTPFFDDISMQWTMNNITSAGSFIFGRRTYETFAAHWPKASQEEQTLAEPFNTRQKYVASNTLTEPLEWQNSTLLQGDATASVAALKQSAGGSLHVFGSTQLVHALLANNLVDELRLMIDPILLGAGKRIFLYDGAPTPLRLTNSQPTTTGAILATYQTAKDAP
ncbi:dihydrofolate reductase family protein [Kribbella qitaiheensis]|uniref:dihydrofolate reductase family protein n=1 Tax=Kribbella qitaiheensis TaxID=1544730 RepID=UPI0036174457